MEGARSAPAPRVPLPSPQVEIEPPALQGALPAGSPAAEEETSPAARRRKRRGGLRGLEDLSHLALPTFEFFFFTLLSGVVLGAALLVGAPALYVLAALLAPFLGPAVGLALGVNGGSVGFFFGSLASLGVSGLLVMACGALAGILSVPLGLGGQALEQAALHARFAWPDLALLLVGAVLVAVQAGRTPRIRPTVASAALAYTIYLPLGAAGFGLFVPEAAGMALGGILTFGAHLALAALVGSLVLCFMGIRPPHLLGWLAGILLFTLLAACAAGLLVLTPGWESPLRAGPPLLPRPTLTFTPEPSTTPTLPPTLTITLPPTRTPTPTLVPTGTQTPTLAPSPTPVWGIINAGSFNGAIIRPEPGSNAMVTSLLNGALLQILPETVNRGGVIWLHVRTTDGKEGWVQATLIATATPVR
jgi:hypothetical protein